VQSEVDKLENHIIVCGYGRIGVELAKALKDGRSPYVVVEQDERRGTPAIAAFGATPPTRRHCWMPASRAPARSPACCRMMPRTFSSR
jgi:voltage-gated potassium channel Kch